MRKRIFSLAIALTAALVAPLIAQDAIAEPRADILQMAHAGIPDTSAFLLRVADLAEVAIEVGNLSYARNAAVLAADLAERYAGATAAERARAHLVNARVTYQISRRHPDGLAISQSAIAAARDAGNRSLELDGLYELARFQRGNRMQEERAATLREMKALCEDLPETDVHRALVYLEMARDENEAKRPEAGMMLARQCIEAFEASDPAQSWKGYDVLASAHMRLEQFEECGSAFNRAIAAYFRNDTREEGGHLFPVTDKLETFFDATTLINHRARLFRTMDRPDLALKDYACLIELRGRQRDANVIESSRMRQSRIVMEFMSEAIECHYEMLAGDPAHAWEALALSEQMKAYGLQAKLYLRRSASESDDTRALRRKIARLEREQPDGIPTSPKLAILELELSLELEASGGLPANFYRFTAADAKAAVGRLPGGMLQYATGYDDGHVFYVDGNKELTMIRMPEMMKTQLGIIDWRDLIEQSAYQSKSVKPASVQDSLDAAYLSLGLRIKEGVLPGIDVATLPEELLIVPDQMTNFLPFAALPLDSVPTPFTYGDLRFLVDDHRISYAYSLRHHEALGGVKCTPKQSGLLAFAPSFTGSASVGDVIAARRNLPVLKSDTGSLPGLSPLAHNEPEALMAVAKIAGGEAVTGSFASKSAFLERLGDANIIHLSSHGVMSARHPKYSFVAFSQSTPDLLEEELIYYNDLPSYGLDADLVVLSACETGMGMVAPGESALTMAAAFIDAGAHSVVSNLWSVDDGATREVMEYFYAGLAEGESRLDAVTLAQRRQRASAAYSHPFYWGALTLYGENGVVEMSAPASGLAWLLGIGGVLFLAGLIWWVYWRR